MPRPSFGTICLCVFLALVGIGLLTNIQVVLMTALQGIFAIAAAFLLIFGK